MESTETRQLKRLSLFYCTILCVSCFSYFDSNPLRLIVMGLFSLGFNYLFYMLYNYMMKHKLLGTLMYFSASFMTGIFMSLFVEWGSLKYDLPFWMWIVTPQDALYYTPYYTIAMFFLINQYISTCIYYATLNRYILTVNFLMLILPFISFARGELFLYMPLAIMSVISFFIMYIASRHTILPKYEKRDYWRPKYKLSGKVRREMEVTFVRKEHDIKNYIFSIVFVITVGAVVLAFPKPTVSADREFFERAINLSRIVDMLTSRFSAFTDVADPSVYRRGSSNTELMRVYADEPLRLKGEVYDEYNFSNGTWSKTYKNHIQIVEKNYPIQSARIEYKNSFLPSYAPVPTGYIWKTYARNSSIDTFKYYSEYNVEDKKELLLSLTFDTSWEHLETDFDRREYSDAMDYRTSIVGNIPEEIQKLSDELTKEIFSDYEKAYAIMEYLRYGGGFTYDLDYVSTDINDFLFGAKTGVCYEFATAMVLLVRAQGIPARFATGFAAYDYVSDDKPYYSVKEMSAHAFPEVYIAGYGWLSFEPTTSSLLDTPAETDANNIKETVNTSIALLIVVAVGFIFYFMVLPIIREKIFRIKVKKADLKTAYSLVFNRLREIFGLPVAATLSDIIEFAQGISNTNLDNAFSIIYSESNSGNDILSEYISILKNKKYIIKDKKHQPS